MKRPIALLFCLLMISMPFAGCIGGDDTVDDSAVTELENEIVMQDNKIAELEAEIANLTIENQQALTDLAAVQSTLQTTQTGLQSAQANATMHQAEISTLEAERDMAQAEISMLYELMSNMSDQSNETVESMALQITQLNQHMSNLSSMLNASYDRHQENATLVSQLTVERDNLQVSVSSYLNQIQNLTSDANTVYFNGLNWIGANVTANVSDIIDLSISNKNGAKFDFSNTDNNNSNWDGIENTIFCVDGYSGSEWTMSCVIFDNSSFRNSIIGEFDGASLKYTDFSYSEGTYLRFRNANMTHAVFAHSEYVSGFFSNADLTYTDFSNVTFTMISPPDGYRNDFSNSNLSFSNFNDASLYGLTFANADLTGATFVGTTFVGNNVWSNTICPDGTNSNDNGNTCENNL